jgi:hypothetical protein
MQGFLTKLFLLQKKALHCNHQGMLEVIQHALTVAKL